MIKKIGMLKDGLKKTENNIALNMIEEELENRGYDLEIIRLNN